jgi:hypothetical protein
MEYSKIGIHIDNATRIKHKTGRLHSFILRDPNQTRYICREAKSSKLKGCVIELTNNQHERKETPINLFYHLKEQPTEKCGFQSSQCDPCLFINKSAGCMLLVYVDDCILFQKEEDKIDMILLIS